MKVSKISEILNDWMPTSIAEDFDNVGLIVGNPESLVTNILITLDTTSEVIDEAIKKDCNLIISYHPIIFNGLKKIYALSSLILIESYIGPVATMGKPYSFFKAN